MLGNSEQYQFEPPVLEEESYASNDSVDGLKREGMIQFLYKWLLWKRRYIIEINMFRNSFRKLCDLFPLPHAISLRFLLRSRARRAPLWMRMLNLLQNGIVIQSYSHSCKTSCDVMFLSVPFYKTKVIIILVFWYSYVKKTLCICDRLTMHTWCESIWCRKNSRSCHNVVFYTEVKKKLTLCVKIALSLRQHLNIIVSLASIGKPNMILYNPIFVLCMQ